MPAAEEKLAIHRDSGRQEVCAWAGSGKGCTDSIKIHFLPCSVTVIEVVMMGPGHYKFSK